MKFSLISLAVVVVSSASAFVQQPTFSRTSLILGAQPVPSNEDLEKTRKVIKEFMGQDEEPKKEEKKKADKKDDEESS